MTGNQFKYFAMRTNDNKADERLKTTMIESLLNKKPILGDLLNGLLGLSGETGELLDLFKKWIFHGKPMDIATEEHARRELGDVLWYLAMTARDLGYTFDEIAQMNVAKLASRKERAALHGNGDNR